MLTETGIRWTDYTWNPIHGCSKTSEGCRHCYAARLSYDRKGWTDHPWTVEHAQENVQVKPERLEGADSPDALDAPAWVFVNSMSDLYHEQVPDEFIGEVFDAVSRHHDSAFQVLTKHGPDDDRDPARSHPANLMLGVSVESPRRLYRLDWLREQPAFNTFVSIEPLVECIPDVDLSGIQWAIIGGESGGGDERREMDPAWARNLVRACRRQDVPVFFKQHSGPRPEEGLELDMQDGRGARRIEEFPELWSSFTVPRPREFLEGEWRPPGQQDLASFGGGRA